MLQGAKCRRTFFWWCKFPRAFLCSIFPFINPMTKWAWFWTINRINQVINHVSHHIAADAVTNLKLPTFFNPSKFNSFKSNNITHLYAIFFLLLCLCDVNILNNNRTAACIYCGKLNIIHWVFNVILICIPTITKI